MVQAFVRSSVLVALWVPLVQLGCGGEGFDGTVALDPDEPAVTWPDAVPAPEPPEPTLTAPTLPTLPELGCPTGWSALEGYEIPVCDPFPGGVAETCPEGEFHFPGTPACAPLGDACAADGFPTDAPASAIFVRPGAGVDAAGTREDPKGSLAAVLGDASPDDHIVLAAGTHLGGVTLDMAVQLSGCLPGTALQGPAGAPAVTITAAGVTLHSLAIAPSEGAGILIPPGGEASVSHVEVTDTASGGIVVDGGQLTAHHLVARGVNVVGGDTANPEGGLVIKGGGSAEVEMALLDDNGWVGVWAQGTGTSLTLRDAAVRRTRATIPTESFQYDEEGIGIAVRNGADAELERVSVDESASFGMFLAGATVHASDLVVQRSGLMHLVTYGIHARDESALTLTRARIERNRKEGLRLTLGSTVTIEDLLVQESLPGRDSTADLFGVEGRGFQVRNGTVATLRRALIIQNRVTGVRVQQGAQLDAEDLTVRDTRGGELEGERGYGIKVEIGSSADLRRVLTEGNRVAGLIVALDANVTVSDLTSRGNLGSENTDLGGQGLQVAYGGTARVERAVFQENREAGVGAYGASSTLELHEVAIEDTRARGVDGRFGAGLVTASATVTGDNVRIARNHQVGLLAVQGGNVSIDRVSIRNTLPQLCAMDGACPGEDFGSALGVYQLSEVRVSEFNVAIAALCGVHVATDASLDLDTGLVSNALLGACVQVDAYDLGRLTHNVAYWNNQRALEATSLPVPEAPPPVAPGS